MHKIKPAEIPGGGAQEGPPLCVELLATDDFWRRELVVFRDLAPERLLSALADNSIPPHI